jgi:hypothetical protein
MIVSKSNKSKTGHLSGVSSLGIKAKPNSRLDRPSSFWERKKERKT